MATAFTPRVRFNWGFWDGRNDAQAKRQPLWTGTHPDASYYAGYQAGRGSADQVGIESSEAAWREEQNAQAARKIERKRLREARPEPTRRF